MTIMGESLSGSELVVSQRMRALQRANDIRCRRAQLKRDLKSGRLWVGTVLASPPEYASAMRVADLLMSTPKVGRTKVTRALSQAWVVPNRTVGQLSERQRRRLVEALTAPARPQISGEQRQILEFVALADGDGCVLARDVAEALFLSPRGMGNRLVGLQHRGLVDRVVVAAGSRHAGDGWVLTDRGREMLCEPRRLALVAAIRKGRKL